MLQKPTTCMKLHVIGFFYALYLIEFKYLSNSCLEYSAYGISAPNAFIINNKSLTI